jgi:hypothetical protein
MAMAELRKRRKRSDLNREDCLDVFENFAKNVVRLKETSGGIGFANETGAATSPFAPRGHITVAFQVKGSFGTIDPITEAIRVLAGHKLPRKGR